MYFFIPQRQKIIFEYLKQNRCWLCLMPGVKSFQKKVLDALFGASDV